MMLSNTRMTLIRVIGLQDSVLLLVVHFTKAQSINIHVLHTLLCISVLIWSTVQCSMARSCGHLSNAKYKIYLVRSRLWLFENIRGVRHATLGSSSNYPLHFQHHVHITPILFSKLTLRTSPPSSRVIQFMNELLYITFLNFSIHVFGLLTLQIQKRS